MRISDWSSDVCSSDLHLPSPRTLRQAQDRLDPGSRCLGIGVHLEESGTPGQARGDEMGDDGQPPIAPQDDRISSAPERSLQHIHRLRQTLVRSEEHTSELQSLMRISYAVFCLKKKN